MLMHYKNQVVACWMIATVVITVDIDVVIADGCFIAAADVVSDFRCCFLPLPFKLVIMIRFKRW